MENFSDKFCFSGVEWIAGELGIPPPSCLTDEAPVRGRLALGDAIAFPGLINSHDHLEFNCYPPMGSPPYRDFVEWSRDVQARPELIEIVEAIPQVTRAQFGLLKNLLWGVTAVADHGGKAISRSEAVAVLTRYRSLHSPELEPWGPLRLLAGGGTVVLHIAEGTTPESRRRALAFLRWNLFRRPIAGVHAVSLEGDDFGRLTALIWCPASNLFLFGQTADVGTAARRTRILFGTDATLSAPGTIWDHLLQARGVLPEQEIFASLTTQAARFWRLPSSRWQQDFVVARRRKAGKWDAFFSITPDDILLVVRGGKIMLVDAALAAAVAPPEEFFPIAWKETRKHVRMPVETMFAELGKAAPEFDRMALIERFAGAPS